MMSEKGFPIQHPEHRMCTVTMVSVEVNNAGYSVEFS